MKPTPALVVVLIGGSLALPATWAEPEATGRVCLAAAPTPTSGERSLGNATGGLPDVIYSVQVDNRPPIQLSRRARQWVEALDVSQRHLVVIRADGRQITSFRFRFPEGSDHDLCLFMVPFYETWQLWPDKRCPWCKCAKAP